MPGLDLSGIAKTPFHGWWFRVRNQTIVQAEILSVLRSVIVNCSDSWNVEGDGRHIGQWPIQIQSNFKGALTKILLCDLAVIPYDPISGRTSKFQELEKSSTCLHPKRGLDRRND
jgi:hypothetical protein